jgi:hypothetical protein
MRWRINLPQALAPRFGLAHFRGQRAEPPADRGAQQQVVHLAPHQGQVAGHALHRLLHGAQLLLHGHRILAQGLLCELPPA